ncbi:hypothetical protein LZ30DRAFT_728853 [Colletotrichum cereale]|nr:hypothetical protein LZ30DRAFT_728853 [Colletotrichum cereale]
MLHELTVTIHVTASSTSDKSSESRAEQTTTPVSTPNVTVSTNHPASPAPEPSRYMICWSKSVEKIEWSLMGCPRGSLLADGRRTVIIWCQNPRGIVTDTFDFPDLWGALGRVGVLPRVVHHKVRSEKMPAWGAGLRGYTDHSSVFGVLVVYM